MEASTTGTPTAMQSCNTQHNHAIYNNIMATTLLNFMSATLYKMQRKLWSSSLIFRRIITFHSAPKGFFENFLRTF